MTEKTAKTQRKNKKKEQRNNYHAENCHFTGKKDEYHR